MRTAAPDLEQCLVDAAQVAGTVIKQSNHGLQTKGSFPFWQSEENNFLSAPGSMLSWRA